MAMTACDDSDTDTVVTPSPAVIGESVKPTTAIGSGTPAAATGFLRVDLVSDDASLPPRQDPDAVNTWGIAAGEQGFWIADEGTGKISIFDGKGNPAMGDYTSGQFFLEKGITGIVANRTEGGFEITCSKTEPADFIVASTTGRLWGINDEVNASLGIVVVDRSADGAVYTGVTMTGSLLLAADFAHGHIDVFDSRFQLLDMPGAFTDPNLPEDYSPFNVAAIGDKVYVAYALVDEEEGEEEAGPGLGIVDVYDGTGAFVMRLATGGSLNAPWGMAMAPANFGSASNMLLVGNFGDGAVTAFDPASGAEMGQLATSAGDVIKVDGLWGIAFGDGIEAGKPDVLYFAAGPDDEEHGLYGRIEKAAM